jgi:hypothetical protein
MKLTILAIATSLTVATSAAAGDFDNTTASVNAEWDRFEIELNGSTDNGYDSVKLGAEVLSYGLGENTTSALDVYLKHYDLGDEVGLGAEYTVTYAPSALSFYGSADLEYRTEADVFRLTPTVGTAYEVSKVTTVWGEVGYTWDVTNDWARKGGKLEVGADFAVADNVALSPSVVHRFDTANDDTQLNLGLNLKF